MFDWDDLRFFLAVARAGSTAAGARELAIDQTTVARRISALERSLGTKLFERRPGGYQMTETAKRALAQAERVESEAAAFRALISGKQREVAGTIRVTGTQVMATYLLGPAIYQIRAAHPALKVEVIVDDRRLDLVRSEADVALRVGSTPTAPSLIAQRMPDSCWSVYCSRTYEAAHGSLGSLDELDRHQIVLGDGAFAASLAWRGWPPLRQAPMWFAAATQSPI